MQQKFDGYQPNEEEELQSNSDSEDADDFFSMYIGDKKRKLNTPALEELEDYLAEPLEELKNRGSILQYWRKRESLYPTLAKMAKDVLACPASSAPSERQFSLSGNTQTKKRNRISAQTLETMVLLRNWQTKKFFK